ncbi:Dyp-type peroxidase [Nocardioides fonticola]|uniref:Dyp-type peroxidase n=1 Tax=Nocardioides fonticola TaxID=450363 RepID=A0ABP7X9R4_9ACTN
MSAPVDPVPHGGWRRRQVFRAGAVALGGASVGWAAGVGASAAQEAGSDTSSAASAPPGPASPPVGDRTVPASGPHQAGVATPPQAFLSLVGLDLLPGVGRADLVRLMRLVTDDIDRLSRGLGALADTEPELAAHPARLSVTVGLGPRIFTDIVPGAPGAVRPLPAFPIDRLEEAWGQTDLALQICADDPLTLAHARRVLTKDARTFVRVRWVQEGFRRAVGVEPDGTSMRNVMGQVDGTGNPTEADADFADLVWSTEPGFVGGTTMIVRRIRARMDAWDKVDRVGREAAVGRRLDTGAPLTGTREFDPPDFEAKDSFGFPVIDPASHLARAHSSDPTQRFLRRPYNYVVPDADAASGEDAGLVFIAFAADAERQFVPVQRRLADLDRLNQWITPIGSAVYAVPPGAGDGDFLAASLLDPTT